MESYTNDAQNLSATLWRLLISGYFLSRTPDETNEALNKCNHSPQSAISWPIVVMRHSVYMVMH